LSIVNPDIWLSAAILPGIKPAKNVHKLSDAACIYNSSVNFRDIHKKEDRL
jgi:hypothetical protein